MNFGENSQNPFPVAEIPAYLKEGDKINVRALLVARNIRQKDLAEKHQIGRSELNKVLSGKRKTHHIREAIATELQMSVRDLWGEE